MKLRALIIAGIASIVASGAAQAWSPGYYHRPNQTAVTGPQSNTAIVGQNVGQSATRGGGFGGITQNQNTSQNVSNSNSASAVNIGRGALFGRR